MWQALITRNKHLDARMYVAVLLVTVQWLDAAPTPQPTAQTVRLLTTLLEAETSQLTSH
jgi:hypothetical protein